MKKTTKRTGLLTRMALAAAVVASIAGLGALAGCSGAAGAAEDDGAVSVSHEAGAMTMPATHYTDAANLKLAEEFTQCSECHEGIDDFTMDGEHDLLSVHVAEFGDAGDEVDCVLCHDAEVSGTAMEFKELDNDGLCMGCHNLDEVAEKTENWNETGANPHKLNHGVFECTSCHTMHTGEQTYYCNKCHHFELPEGWASPDYLADSQPFESF